MVALFYTFTYFNMCFITSPLKAAAPLGVTFLALVKDKSMIFYLFLLSISSNYNKFFIHCYRPVTHLCEYVMYGCVYDTNFYIFKHNGWTNIYLLYICNHSFL